MLNSHPLNNSTTLILSSFAHVDLIGTLANFSKGEVIMRSSRDRGSGHDVELELVAMQKCVT